MRRMQIPKTKHAAGVKETIGDERLARPRGPQELAFR